MLEIYKCEKSVIDPIKGIFEYLVDLFIVELTHFQNDFQKKNPL